MAIDLTATGPVEARQLDGTLEYAYDFSGTATRLDLSNGNAVASPVSGDEDAEVAARIRNAMSAAPSSISANATILDYEMDDAGKFIVLREGSNDWSCFPDITSTPGNDPQCNDQAWMDWTYALFTGEEPNSTVPGLAYMLQGGSDASNTDPAATEPAAGENWVSSPPHVMLIMPEELDQSVFATDHASGEPFIMWAGTPYEHIMMPVADGVHMP